MNGNTSKTDAIKKVSVTSRTPVVVKMKWIVLLLVPPAVYVMAQWGDRQSFYYYLPDIEKEHAPTMYTTERTRIINGSDTLVAEYIHSPDFRIEEPPFIRHKHYFMIEEERPYRVSPAYKQLLDWRTKDNAHMTGCACTTVFKMTHMLAGCAVLTLRHVLTTATSTELILRSRRQFTQLYRILGIWYDTNRNVFNSSVYATPVRIHYHPKYIFPKQVNRSHPLPLVYDLAIWTTMRNMYGGRLTMATTYICDRGGSHTKEYASSVPGPDELALLVGYQFMKAFHRKPMPWFKYAVRTRRHLHPCPKTEWGWHHCVIGNWAKLGMDQGGSMFRALEGKSWRYDGLIGMNVMSMILRSYEMIHYYKVLNTHEVLEFVYNAITSRIKYQFLDKRFRDTRDRAPSAIIKFKYPDPAHIIGHEHFVYQVPNY